MKLQLSEIPTMTKRNGNTLVIFPSRPYWFAATGDVEYLMHCLQNEVEYKAVLHLMIERSNIDHEEASLLLDEMIEILYENRVLSVNKNLSDESVEIEPDFQLNSVENVLVIAATQECNLHCPHCYALAGSSLPQEMTTDEIKSLIDGLSDMEWKNDISRVGLTGGEFFLRPDALDIVEYVYDQGFKVLISSNGLLIDDEIVRHLSKYKDIKVSISLDGSNADLHEIIRGKGTFLPTIKNIKKLADEGIFVGANMFVHQDNFDFIEETLELAYSLGVQSFNCLNMLYVGRANTSRTRNQLERIPEHKLYWKLFEILKDNVKYQKMMLNSTFANQVMGIAAGVKSHYCGIGTNRALYVKADGNIYPCPDTALPRFKLGNVKDESLKSIWETSPILQELRTINVDTMNLTCSRCDVRYFCGGSCRGENYQVNRNLFSPHFDCEEIKKTII